jgi:hypothetical protein
MAFKCPLCNSAISRETYDKVSGVEKERERAQENLRRQLEREKERLAKDKNALAAKYKKEKQQLVQVAKKAKLEALHKIELAKKLEKQKAEAIKIAGEKRILQKEKEMQKKLRNEEFKRTSLSKSLLDRENQIKVLQEQLKKGTTPQSEGLLEEKILLHKLKELFKTDKFDHTGKGGDIIQTVIERGREIGKIVYECKKVAEYKKEYIDQTRKARQERSADFAVLVTNKFPKKAQGYFVEKQVFVINPISVELISQTLRGSLVQLSLLKGDPALKDVAIQKIYSFLSSNDYSNRINDFVGQIIELRKDLESEVNSHARIWTKRYKGYALLYGGVHALDGKLKDLITIEASSSATVAEKLPAIPMLENFKVKS